jgi:Domain of unknown function (DUF932)
MTVRTNIFTGETEYLGIVGTDYTTVQNEEAAEVLNRLVDESGAHFETAGSLRGGRMVFITMKLPTSMRIAGVDDMDLYLCATTSHDGTCALRVDASPIRVVCANTQRAAIAASKGSYTFRHTSNVRAQIAQAREAMGLMWTYLDGRPLRHSTGRPTGTGTGPQQPHPYADDPRLDAALALIDKAGAARDSNVGLGAQLARQLGIGERTGQRLIAIRPRPALRWQAAPCWSTRPGRPPAGR